MDAEQIKTRRHNAIRKAREVSCEVSASGLDAYEVTTPEGHTYTVRFETVDGVREAFCTCAAGYTEVGGMQYRNACYHCVHAATLDSYLTGYPAPCPILLVALALKRKGDEIWTDEAWADLGLRVRAPHLYWQQQQAVCPRCEGEHDLDAPCIAAPTAEAEDRRSVPHAA